MILYITLVTIWWDMQMAVLQAWGRLFSELSAQWD